MTEIKRFVSYIYLYNQGVKENNVGFAKVDSRNGQCKITVNIKGMEQSNGKSEKVYLFYRNQEKIFGIYIGSFQIINGIGEFHEQLQTQNLKETGKSLDEMNGILVREEDRNIRVYASGWDDYTISVNQFYLHEEESEKTLSDEKTEEQLRASEVEEERKEPIIFIDKTWKEESVVTDQSAVVAGIPEEKEERKQETEPVRKAESLQDTQKFPVNTEIMQTTAVVQKTGNAQEMGLQQNSKNSQAIISQQAADSLIVWEQMSWQEYQEEPQQDKGLQKSIPDEKEQEVCHEPETPQEPEETSWEKLCHQFPKIRAFVDEPECLCLKIDLRDLHVLPSENWILGNNSFLLHGYYNFRYLILTQENGNCFLGIPGIYHPNEKMMATMFGFGGFKPVKLCDKMLGQFGYWCKKVTL